MSWDSIAEILTSQLGDIEMDQGTHEIILVEPQSNDRAVSRTRIVTRTIRELLWERDSDSQWRNYDKISKASSLHEETSAKDSVEHSSSQPFIFYFFIFLFFWKALYSQ